ncbi:MAG TPA: recombinase RecT [Polyangiaceae bacterium]|nr:recombinase RecT [Polyangiaceae bacterium]
MGRRNQAIATAEPAAAPAKARLELRDYLLSPEVKRRVQDVASKYLSPEEITRCTLLAASRNPKIASCTTDSILRCMMDAAIVGIRPGGTMGRGWLIPRWNSKIKAYELTFDPGWRGLADIARRSKVVRDIDARAVYRRDHFRVIEGTSPRIEHEPSEADDPGEIVAAYAVAHFTEDHTKFEVLRRRDLDKIMAASTSRDEKTGELVGPWVEWEEEMARKSAVRRICKHLPYQEELEFALETATRAEKADFDVVAAVPVEPAPAPAARAKSLADRIRAQQSAQADPAPEPSDPSLELGDDPADLGPR